MDTILGRLSKFETDVKLIGLNVAFMILYRARLTNRFMSAAVNFSWMKFVIFMASALRKTSFIKLPCFPLTHQY